MNNCMMAHASMEEQDRAREEWFATREDRVKQREKEAAEHAEKLKLKRDYWGVDETGRLLDKDKRTSNISVEQADAFKRRGR
jgi:COX assembly mitochondrial protein 1